ncbi:MAG: PLDc N-terminal domain-containing protein [Bilophila wadsworthia]
MLYISLLLALLAVACLIFVPNTVILLSFVAIMHGFAVYSACHALLHKRDSRAALGWIAIILFMPPVGLPLYWLFGIARIDSQAVRLMEKAAQKVMGGLVDLHGKSLTEKPEGFIDKDEVPHAWHYPSTPAPASPAAVCSKATTHRAAQRRSRLSGHAQGHQRGQGTVFLSSFIFGYDEVGKSFAAAPRAAAERGCDVRLLMDGVGSFHLRAELAQTPRPGRQARLLPAAAPHPAPVFHQPADAPQSPDLRQRNRLHRRHEHFPEPPRQPEAPLTGAGRALPLPRPHRAAA